MVDELVDKVAVGLPIRAQRVGVERRAGHDVLVNLGMSEDARDSGRPSRERATCLFRAALHHAEHRRFAGAGPPMGTFLPTAFMRVGKC